jgi:outer membrane protein TolC
MLMAGIMSSQAMANDFILIKVNSLVQPLSVETMNRDGYTYVAMRDMFNMLDAEVDWNSNKRCITATRDGREIKLYVDTNKAEIDGEEKDIVPPIEIVDGTTMVPLRFVSDALQMRVDWDMDSHTISITNDTGKYLFLNEKDDIVDDEQTDIISYDEALEMAQKKSSQLKAIDDSLDYLDELRTDLGETYHTLDEYSVVLNTFGLGSEYDSTSFSTASQQLQLRVQSNIESTIDVARSIKNVDMQKTSASLNEEIVNNSIEITLISYLTAIQTYEMNIQLLEENIKLQEENLENMKLKNELGMESDYNVKSAETEVKTNKTNLEQLKLSLENQKQTLKTFLGSEKDVYVDFDTDFNALKDVNLESYVIKKTQADPSIKLLKNDVEIAKYTVKTNSGYQSESQTQVYNELKTAQRSLSDAQDKMEKNIRNTYNTIKQLEENNKALLEKVEQAKRDYNTVAVSYQADRATIYQVNQAKLGILSAEQAVQENILNYKSLVFTFEHPYLIS